MIYLILFSTFGSFGNFDRCFYSKHISYLYNFYTDKDIVVTDIYANKDFVEIESITTIQDMLKRNMSENLRNMITQEVITTAQKQQGYLTQGIVPKIELPLKLPPMVKNIIGEGGEINVDGSQSIMMKLDRSTSSLANIPSEGMNNSLMGSLQPQLKTDLNLKISGTVGKKIHVSVDHNSANESEYKNKVRLWYQGNEDDIFQYIKAGNIDNVPGVSGAERKGLFGIHTKGKIGGVDFDAVTARIQSKTVADSFVGNAGLNVDTIYDRDFVPNKYYLLGLSPGDSIISIKLYVDTNYSITSIPASCYYNPPYGAVVDSGEFEQTNAFEIQGFYTQGNKILPYIELKRIIDDSRILAVSYIYFNYATNTVDTVGTFDIDSLNPYAKLKILKTASPSPSDSCWGLSLKNIYSFGGIGARNIAVDIYYNKSGAEDPTVQIVGNDTMFFMELLGLDRDGIPGIDARQVNTEEGTIIFPDLTPFANPALINPDSVIYTTTTNNINNENLGQKYYIVVKYSSPQMFYSLQAPIVDSSEVITLEYGGRVDTLIRGKDYNLNYSSGALQFLTSKVAQPEAKVKIKWDMVPLLSYTSRYITQFTTNSHPFSVADLNTSISFSTSSTRDERPKFGEEPNSILIGSINSSSNFNNPILGYFAHILPFVNEKTPSKFGFNGKMAFSIPQISSKGKGYIDDMESSVNSFSMPLGRNLWHLSSIPIGEESNNVAAQFHWFISNELAGDINPNLPEEEKHQRPPVLNLYFVPEDNDTASWGGISTFFNDVGWDISDKEFLDVWVQGDTGFLFIDLATNLAEDAPRRNKGGEIVGLGIFESEDKNMNGTLDNNEDTGLDKTFGNDVNWTSGSDDDGNDDYPEGNISSLEDTLKLNGTENNKHLDTEDLDNNGKEEKDNNYYEYKIDLSSDSLVYIKGKNGWKMYRIPLFGSKYLTAYGKPDSTHIREGRIWMKGVSSLSRIKLYKVDITGAKWINKGIFSVQDNTISTDSTMKFSILFRDNFNDSLYAHYLPFDPGRDIYGRTKMERSLVLSVENLNPGYYGYTMEYFPKKMDFRLYKTITFDVKKAFPKEDSLEFFMRMMTDSINYYQYSIRLSAGDSSWKYPEINFDKFLSMKISGDTIRNEGNATYYICGNPTFQEIQWIGAGVINRGKEPATNEIWWDELVLTNPNNRRGMETSVRLNANLGDFSTFTLTFSNNTPFFKHGINDLRQLGSASNINYTQNLKIKGDKLLFDKFSLPINYTMQRGKSIPYYYINSDIVLPDSLRFENTGTKNNTSISMGISKKGQSNFPLFKYTIDQINVQGMRSFSTTFSPNKQIDTTYQENAALSYSVPFPILSIPLPFRYKWKIFPENISFASSYNYNRKSLYEKIDSAFVKKPQETKKSLNGRFSLRYSPIRLFSLSYNAQSDRDIRNGWKNGGIENNYRESGTIRGNLGILNIINNTGDYSYTYTENHSEGYRTSFGDSIGDIRGIAIRHSLAGGMSIKVSKILRFIPSLRDKTKDKDAPIMSLQWILSKIDNIGSHIGDLQSNATYERQSNYACVKERPKIMDRIMMLDTLPVKRFPNPSDGLVRNLSFSGSESFNLSPLSIRTSYRWSKNIPKISTNTPIRESVTFPNINISLSSVERILHLKKLLNSLSFSLNVVKDSSHTYYTFTGNRQETTVAWSYSPSSQIELPKRIQLSINGNYRDEFSYSSADISSTTENKHMSIGASSGYSFSAPTGINLPFLKNRIKFASNLNLKFTFNQSEDYKIQISAPLDTTQSENVNVQSHKKTTSVEVSGNYQFSPSVTGEMGVNNRHTLDIKKNDTFDLFELYFKVIFKF